MGCASPDLAAQNGIAWTLFGYNAFLALVGAFLAFDTREVNSQFRESRMIGVAIYNICVIGVVFVPFIVTNSVSFLIQNTLLCIALILIPAITVLTLFAPKVVYILRPDLAPEYDSSHKSPHDSEGASKRVSSNQMKYAMNSIVNDPKLTPDLRKISQQESEMEVLDSFLHKTKSNDHEGSH